MGCTESTGWASILIVVHLTVLQDVTVAASDSEAHAVKHAKAGERNGTNRYMYTIQFVTQTYYNTIHSTMYRQRSAINGS